jgi:hypothetical protein
VSRIKFALGVPMALAAEVVLFAMLRRARPTRSGSPSLLLRGQQCSGMLARAGSTVLPTSLLPSPSFRDKLIFALFPQVSGGAGAGLVYYPCQRLGA